MKRTLAILLVLMPFIASGAAKPVPMAPLPLAITSAKTVLLVNGGGNELAYDAFYLGFKEWGKYKIAGSPADADLIIEIRYRVETHGANVESYPGSQVDSGAAFDPQVQMTILDARSKTELWLSMVHARPERDQEKRETEIVNTATRLVQQLRARSEAQVR